MTAETLALGGLGMGGAASMIGATMSLKSAYMESSYLRENGNLQYYDALMEAHQTEERAAQFKENQTMQYVMAGVSLQGTPMQVLDYTSKQAELEVNLAKQRGQRLRELAYAKANYAQTAGWGTFAGGLLNAGSEIAKGYRVASEAGMFNNKNTNVIGTMVESAGGQMQDLYELNGNTLYHTQYSL